MEGRIVGLNGRKRGHNRGILKTKRARKRAEAEARNILTLPENRRKARQKG